mgnify:CR=1 FL=1
MAISTEASCHSCCACVLACSEAHCNEAHLLCSGGRAVSALPAGLPLPAVVARAASGFRAFLLLGCVSSFAVLHSSGRSIPPPTPPPGDPYLAHDEAQRSRQRRARRAVPVAQWDLGRLQVSAVQQRLPGFLQHACAQSTQRVSAAAVCEFVQGFRRGGEADGGAGGRVCNAHGGV